MDPNTITHCECECECENADDCSSHQSIDEDKLENNLLHLPCSAGVAHPTESLQRKKGRLQRSTRLKSDTSTASYSTWEALVKESFGQMAWPIKIKSWELVDDRVQVPNSTSATELISRRGVFSRRNYGSVDQIPQTDLDGIDPNCKRFRVENGESLAEKDEVFGSPSTPILENPEHQTRWYFKYFLGKLHQNYNGIDSDKNPYFLSVVTQDSGNQGAPLYRAILFRKQGAQKIALSFGPNHKPSAKQILGHFTKADVSGKNPKELFSADIQKDLLLLEEQEGSVNFKFGVIYMKSGQTCDDEMLSNENASDDFNNFLEILGEKIRLKGWDNFRGGLDVKGDMTGKYSVYTLYEGHEIMFHVSTLLPFSRDNKQQVERKRHIGNDIVNIVYMEKGDSDDDDTNISPLTFDPNWIRSQFTHIFAVVTKENKKYKLAIFCDENVPPYGPTLPNPPEFSDYSMFRQFLLVKLINAEKAAFQTPLFARKRERTLEMLIKDLHEEYSHDNKQNMLYRRAFSEVLYDAPRTSKLKEEARQVEFVRIGQALKLEAIVRGDAPTSLASASPCTVFKRPPWEPHCFFPALQHRGTLAGDSFGNDCLFICTDDGTFLIQEDQSHHLVFDKSLQVKQLSVLEEHGLLLIRGGSSNNRDGHRIHVFRLKEFQTPVLNYRSRIEVKDRRIDRTRGCHLYTTSKINGGHLKLAVAIGKKISIFQWKHSAAWASWCSESDNETADGFLFQREIQLSDVPTIITILEWANSPSTAGVLCVGFKHHFEIVSDINGSTNRLFEVESAKRNQTQLNAAIELCDGQETELLLCYNHTCHFQKLNENTVSNEFDFHWNTSPISVVCAFPYILAFTSDSIEIRLLVNGNLVHTAIMPELKLITSKRDIFFVTTAPEFFSRDPMTKTQNQLLQDSSQPSTNSSEEDSDKVLLKTLSDASDKIPINTDNDLNTLLVPQTRNDGIQRAKSLQKTRCASDDNKRLISKSNSCGDSHMASEREPPILEAPPNTPRAISRINSPISPTKRHPKYRNPFINSTEQTITNSPERVKPLRIYRIPLSNLTGSHSHFHMQTIASITRQPEIKRHHLPSDNISETDTLPDDYNSINSINEAIDSTTCNCGNLSIFTS